MLKDTLKRIEDITQKIETQSPKNKEELVRLLEKLKAEIGNIGDDKVDDAKSVAHFAEAAFHEAGRDKKVTELQDLSRGGLEHSVKSFEVSHPQLVKVVNEICVLLARIGI
ncbi:MAG: DUF4404 family protein [Elusimicrobiota bacterium]|nr:DUF4404 family protein [Elusimicrobiota bacterium]